MMRTKGSSKLTNKERQELILDLCRALCTLKTPEEVAEALTDLLSPKETETIAKRLKIAELLVQREDYNSIRSQLKVGYSTIARVNTWLNLSGEGFKILLNRKKKSPKLVSEQEKYDPYSWHNIKRRYTLYYWPQLLLEELIKASSKKEKQRIAKILEKLNLKASTFRAETNKAIFESFDTQVKKKFPKI
jgi:TrpR-related protein YerC/YecD